MTQPAPSAPLPSAPASSPTEPPASFWIRAAAASVDLIILWLAGIAMGVPVWVVGMMLPLGSGVLRLFAWLVFALQFAVPLFYFAATESGGRQATLGKRFLGLAVIGIDGGRIELERALARTAAKVLSALPVGLGFVAAAFTRDHRALHDFVASTRVVQRRPAGALGLVVGILAAALVGARLLARLMR